MKSLHKILLIALLCAASTSFSQHHYQAAKAIVAPQIDGLGNDACWSGSNWHAVDQLWLGVQPSADDFSERFKVCWDANKLYVLAEVTDDSLGDNYANPLVNYWEDDTWEVFIDEDHSGGIHDKSYNAFGYHISAALNAVDVDIDGLPHLYNSNLSVQRTANAKVYTWEAAFDVYTDAFVYGALDNPKAALIAGKIMGFAMAYCDNDGGTHRQSFMGSEVIDAVDKNIAYKNASVFASLELVEVVASSIIDLPKNSNDFTFFPNPAAHEVTVRFQASCATTASLEVLDSSASLLTQQSINVQKGKNSYTLSTQNLAPGIYLLRYYSGSHSECVKLVVE